MPKDDALYLGHMLDMSRSAVAKVQGRTRADFDADENLRLALAHLIQIIGEAANRVSTATQLSHPNVPWRQVIGMRHHIVHDYLDLDEDTVWAVVTQDLPSLIEVLSVIDDRTVQ